MLPFSFISLNSKRSRDCGIETPYVPSCLQKSSADRALSCWKIENVVTNGTIHGYHGPRIYDRDEEEGISVCVIILYHLLLERRGPAAIY